MKIFVRNEEDKPQAFYAGNDRYTPGELYVLMPKSETVFEGVEGITIGKPFDPVVKGYVNG